MILDVRKDWNCSFIGYLLSHDEMAEWISLVLECDLSLGSATYNRRHLDPFKNRWYNYSGEIW